MAAAGVEVEGLARLEATLAQLARALPDVAPAEAARVIGQQARLNAPKRSGRLAASWAATDGQGALGLSFGAPHASPIHWGVGARPGLRGPHNIRASRYLITAIESTRAQWVADYQQEISELVGKVKGA